MTFQKIFSKPGNEKITKKFLSAILDRPIDEIDLDCNKRQLDGGIDEKVGRLDLRAKTKTGEDFNCELQIIPYNYMGQRMLYYWSKNYSSKLKTGNNYNEMTKTSSILIANFELKEFSNIDKYHKIFRICEDSNLNTLLTSDFEIHILEIPKMLKSNPDFKKDKAALWLKFLVDPDCKEVVDMFMTDEELKLAWEELDKLRGNPENEREIYLREKYLNDEVSFRDAAREEGLEEGREQGLEEGREQGLEEGREQGLEQGLKKGIKKGNTEGRKKEKYYICIKLLGKGMNIAEISEITELSEKEIEKIATKI